MSKHIKLDRGRALLSSGYSLIVAGADKMPCHKWKELQTRQWSEAELEAAITNDKAWRYGYVTGYGGLFTVDVDLKVLPMEMRAQMWDEFIKFIRDNIDGFDRKVSVHKTLNFGRHLTYRTNTDMGNEKLAVPCKTGLLKEGSTKHEALIECRSHGGYCVLYDESENDLDYVQIGTLSEDEHNTIIAICRMWDERVEEQEVEQPRKDKTEYKAAGLTPWQDFNERHTVFDVIGDEFKVIRNLSSKTIIKRHGATSAHSGYVFKDSGCMYLFSTGTRYPHEKLLSPFALHAYRYHGGNMSEAAKAIYATGYGDRIKRETPSSLTVDVVPPQVERNDFPLDVFPTSIGNYINECNRTLGHSVDFMGSGLLWMLSVIIGNSIKVDVKNGWTECVVVWLAIVGRAGVGKTPAINSIIRPLVDVNSREIREYRKMKEKYEAYEKLNKDDKANTVEVRKPNRGQFIVNDVTIEALVELHDENPNAVGVFKDELAGWIKDMNKYRAGGDLEFWLSSFSNSPAYTTRKTVRDNYIHSPIIPVLGGIQPAVLNQVFTDEYRDNGFSDRLLLCYPDTQVERWNENELDDELLQWYNDYILSLYGHIRSELRMTDDGDVISTRVRFSGDAKAELGRIMNKITDRQNSEEETEATKSILPKQKTYLPRFSILLHVLECYDNGEVFTSEIQKDTILNAERLVDYFISMAEKVMQDGVEYGKLRASAGDRVVKTDAEKFAAMYAANPNLKRTEAASLLKVSRQQIYRWITELETMNSAR
jgi:hypothetical protein